MSKKALLMILDGWGIGNHSHADVIYNTPTPYWDYLLKTYPHSQLQASGENVGLPDGQMGNSEVGHLNIGAGRIVYQDLTMITKAIEDGSFFENEALQKAQYRCRTYRLSRFGEDQQSLCRQFHFTEQRNCLCVLLCARQR